MTCGRVLLFEGVSFKFHVEVECFSKCYLQKYVYLCLCVRVRVCGVLITSSHTCFPRRLSLPSSDASSSKPDPATVVASLSLQVLPSPPSSRFWLSFNSRYSSCITVLSRQSDLAGIIPTLGRKFMWLGGCTCRCYNSWKDY